jgi:release factor glutamine methyltransferase
LLTKLLKRTSQAQFWWRNKVQKRHNQLCLEKIAGLDLLILPEVFNPVLFGTSAFLAEYLRQNSDIFANTPTVLDLGCGSGILGLTAARLGGKVIATDANPHAVHCTKLNAMLNQLEDKVEVWQGVLFEPLKGEKPDIILCNPPYFAKEPKTELERAFFAGSNQIVLQSILTGIAVNLAPNGQALLVVSDQIGFEKLLDQLDLGHLRWRTVARQKWWAEEQLVYVFS